jgi:hypothetical protein
MTVSQLIVSSVLAEISVIVAVNLVLWLWVLLMPTRVVLVQRLHVSGAGGLALPGVIFLTASSFNERILRHEYTHIRQMKRYSPFGVAILLGFGYLRLAAIHIVRHRSRPSFWQLYKQHPLEREAFAAMEKNDPLGRLKGSIPSMN